MSDRNLAVKRGDFITLWACASKSTKAINEVYWTRENAREWVASDERVVKLVVTVERVER